MNLVSFDQFDEALTWESIQKNPYGLVAVGLLVGLWLLVTALLYRMEVLRAQTMRVPRWKQQEQAGFFYRYFADLHTKHRFWSVFTVLPMDQADPTPDPTPDPMPDRLPCECDVIAM